MSTRLNLAGWIVEPDKGGGWVLARERTITTGKSAGRVIKERPAYFPTLLTACQHLLDRKLAGSGAQTVQEIHDALNGFRKELEPLFNPSVPRRRR